VVVRLPSVCLATFAALLHHWRQNITPFALLLLHRCLLLFLLVIFEQHLAQLGLFALQLGQSCNQLLILNQKIASAAACRKLLSNAA